MGKTYIPTSNDTVVHHWLVGLVLEITLPSVFEVRSWPCLKLPQLLSSWAHFDTGLNAVGCERSSSLLVPLVKDLWNRVSGWVEKLGVFTYASGRRGLREQSRRNFQSLAWLDTWRSEGSGPGSSCLII